MTDTARSLAAIKALFADNATGDISPQDGRDLIESVANPVADGGVNPARALFKRIYGQSHFYSGGFATIPASTSGNTSASIALDVGPNSTPALYNNVIDPSEFWDATYELDAADPNNSWGMDRPAGSCVMLPPGAYIATAFIQLTANLDAATQWACAQWDQTEFDDGYDYGSLYYPNNTTAEGPWIYDSYFGPLVLDRAGTPSSNFTPNDTTRYLGSSWSFNCLLVNDADEPKPFGVVAFQRNNTSPAVIQYLAAGLFQIGGVGW